MITIRKRYCGSFSSVMNIAKSEGFAKYADIRDKEPKFLSIPFSFTAHDRYVGDYSLIEKDGKTLAQGSWHTYELIK